MLLSSSLHPAPLPHHQSFDKKLHPLDSDIFIIEECAVLSFSDVTYSRLRGCNMKLGNLLARVDSSGRCSTGQSIAVSWIPRIRHHNVALAGKDARIGDLDLVDRERSGYSDWIATICGVTEEVGDFVLLAVPLYVEVE